MSKGTKNVILGVTVLAVVLFIKWLWLAGGIIGKIVYSTIRRR